MTKKEDHRITKTKAALNRAFGEIIAERPFEDISVNELCQKTGIRRATFYNHYKDKYEFFGAYVSSLLAKYEPDKSDIRHIEATIDYYVKYAEKIIEYVNENEKLMDSLIKSAQLHIIIGIVTEKAFLDVREKLRSSVSSGMQLPASVETTTTMIVGGVATTVVQWILSERKVPVDVLTQEISLLVRRCLSEK